MQNMQTFIAGLPKAELHMHLEGCIEPAMMFELAKRNGVTLRWQTPEELERAYTFDDLQSFLNLYFEGCRVLLKRRDFFDITYAYLKRAASDSVKHAEMFIGPQTFVEQGTPLADLMEGVLEAMEKAEREFQITSGLLISAHRHRTEQAALELLESIEPWRDRVAGIGMGGAELPHPPSKFVGFFAEARRRGYRTSIHAGEEGPAGYVRQAIELLKVDRIDHGNACLNDPSLVDLLVKSRVPLTVCPLSNLKLKVVAADVPHPLRAMLDVGLIATISSDDPPYFGGYVNENFDYMVNTVNVSREEAIVLARNSFQAAFLPHEQIAGYLRMIDDYVNSAANNNRFPA